MGICHHQAVGHHPNNPPSEDGPGQSAWVTETQTKGPLLKSKRYGRANEWEFTKGPAIWVLRA